MIFDQCQAVSPQVVSVIHMTASYLLAAQHHCCLASTKLHMSLQQTNSQALDHE